MEAFKAANPSASLEDFIRWHSPKDWENGQLSQRMIEKDNLWQQLWNFTRRIPACRQTLIFNFENEGEKSLHWLENIGYKKIIEKLVFVFNFSLFPGFFLIIYDNFYNYSLNIESLFIREKMLKFSNFLINMDWNYERNAKYEQELMELIENCREVESIISCGVSLKQKFSDSGIVSDLLENIFGDQRSLCGVEIGHHAIQKDFRPNNSPISKEFTIESRKQLSMLHEIFDSNEIEKEILQKMYFKVSSEELKIVKCCCVDTISN